MRTTSQLQCTAYKACHRCAIVPTEDPGARYLFPKCGIKGKGDTRHFLKTGGEPFIPNIQADDTPEPGHAGIGKQELRDRRLRDLRSTTRLNCAKETHDSF